MGLWSKIEVARSQVVENRSGGLKLAIPEVLWELLFFNRGCAAVSHRLVADTQFTGLREERCRGGAEYVEGKWSAGAERTQRNEVRTGNEEKQGNGGETHALEQKLSSATARATQSQTVPRESLL